MKPLTQERKAQMLVLFSEQPRTTFACAELMGLHYEKLHHIVTQMVKDKEVFAIGYDNGKVVYSTRAKGDSNTFLNTNQMRLLELLEDGPKSGIVLQELSGLSVGRTYDALRNLRELKKVYVQSKVAGQHFYAAGSEPDVVPKRRRKPPTKAQRIANMKRKEDRQRAARLASFERQRLEGIAKNARMLPFAW